MKAAAGLALKQGRECTWLAPGDLALLGLPWMSDFVASLDGPLMDLHYPYSYRIHSQCQHWPSTGMLHGMVVRTASLTHGLQGSQQQAALW